MNFIILFEIWAFLTCMLVPQDFLLDIEHVSEAIEILQ